MKPMKILILDNTREDRYFGSSSLQGWVLRMAPAGSEVWVRRPPHGDLPVGGDFDAICISGSVTSCMTENEAWIPAYDAYVTEHIRARTPILGICYGHQTLARCLFKMAGKSPALGRSKDAELGWQTITTLKRDSIFEGLGESFVSYQSHYEEVSETPPGTIRIAETDRCAVQAFEMEGAPVFGIQFHPEHSIEYAEESLANKLKKGERRDWILNPGMGKKLYDENVGIRIFGNFFRIANT
jgi:GMP synthase-like glutamine amidotransferase